MDNRWEKFSKDELFYIGMGLTAAVDATEEQMRSTERSGEPESVKKLELASLQDAYDSATELLDEVMRESVLRLKNNERFGPFAESIFQMRKDGLH